MSEVKRYEPDVFDVPIERGYTGRLQKLVMMPSTNGEWVKAEDYAAMAEHAAMVEMERDRLRAEVDAFREDAANYYRVAKEADAQQAALRARVAELERDERCACTWDDEGDVTGLCLAHAGYFADRTEDEIETRLREFAGWLSGDIPELRKVEVPLLAESLVRFLDAMRKRCASNKGGSRNGE